mmetsp:Transcript_23957/g.36712  ORF Transcript_23957/g.36712 Transcript_23957/m.36712 type:complete len:121 (-) Transcript_23957:54-416(-)
MTGMYIGNYFSRSFLYDYFLNRGLSLSIIQTVNTVLFVILQQWGVTTHLFIFDNLAYLFTFSLLLGIPAGSIYSSSLLTVNSGGLKGQEISKKEREMGVNLLFIAMDFGSLLAQGVATFL